MFVCVQNNLRKTRKAIILQTLKIFLTILHRLLSIKTIVPINENKIASITSKIPDAPPLPPEMKIDTTQENSNNSEDRMRGFFI